MGVDVSIIIPTYNRLWSLPQAVESCRGTESEVEILVVDDASDDGTWEWLQGQPDVKSLKGKGLGKPWAVNRAFKQSKGRYVRFLDSDDWLHTRAIDEQYEVARTTGADLIVAGYDVYEDQDHLETRSWVRCDDFIAQQLGECESSHYSAFLFRRELLNDVPHRPDFELRDDRLLMLEVALKDPEVAVYEEPAFCHRHHDKTRLQAVHGMRDVMRHYQQLRLYTYILRRLRDENRLTMRRRRAAAKILWPVAHRIGYTHLDEAIDVAEWVFELDPSFTPPEEGFLGWMYRRVGFRWTEYVLQVRRLLLNPFRTLPSPTTHTFEVSDPEEAPANPLACPSTSSSSTESVSATE